MVIFPYKHSFATQILWEKNIKIYNKNQQVLSYPFEKPHWSYPQLITQISLGRLSSSLEKKEYTIIEFYDDLQNIGFQITTRKASGKFFKGQKVEYRLIKRNPFKYDLGAIPVSHKLEYDSINKRIRLIGKNSNGIWIYLRHKREYKDYDTEIDPYDSNKMLGTYHSSLQNLSPFFVEEEQKSILINEIPVMMSDDGRLICKARGRDTPIIGWYGMRRSGKSMGLHGYLDRSFHKFGIRPLVANDIQRETGTWCLEWNNNSFLKQLENIGEISQPLPMVYLHPKTYDSKSLTNEEVSFFISLPFKEGMREYEWFLKGKKEWEFEKSGVYFRNLMFNDDGTDNKEGLFKCKSYIDITNLIDTKETKNVEREERGRIIQESYTGYKINNDRVRDKLKSVFKDLCNTQIFDIINGIPPKWTIEMPDGKHFYSSWLACMITGLVPSIITSELRTKHFFPQYFRHIIDSLFQFQKEDPISTKNKWEVGLYIDELQSITNNEDTKETLNKIVRESGLARIGVYYTTLNVEKVPDDMKLNTDTVFVFKQKKQQASLIAKDFDLLNYKEKEMRNLKPFECIAIGNFVAYNADGDRELISDEPIKGKILPSVSMHQAPRVVGGEDEDI